MKLLAPAAQQRAIGRVLDEGVLEDERRLLRAAAAEYQSSFDQLVQLVLATDRPGRLVTAFTMS
mgnify:CR=1 FL=1